MAQGRSTQNRGKNTSSRGAQSSQRGRSSGSRSGNANTQQRRTTKTKAAIEREMAEIRRKRQSVAVVLFACAILMFVLVVFPGIGGQLSTVIYGLFGISGILWCFLLFYLSILLALDRPESKIGIKLSQATLIILMISSFIHMAMPVAKELIGRDFIELVGSLYSRGAIKEGSGLIGGLFGAFMVNTFGRVLAMIIVALATFVMIMLLTQTGLIQLFKSVSDPVKSAAERAAERAAVRAAERANEQEDPYSELRSRKKYFEIDVPVGDNETQRRPKKSKKVVDVPVDDEVPALEAEPSKRKKNSNAAQDVLKELSEQGERKPSRRAKNEAVGIKAEAPVENEPVSLDDDEDFEALLQKVAGAKSKKQRVEEIAREAVDFAREVDKSEEPQMEEYKFPPIDLLIPQDNSDEGDIRAELKSNAEQLVETLAEYNVAASVVDISRGPAVTRYELKPAPGVKISKITSLTNDIALRLAAQAVRIEAPIPGKAAVGIEIPNQSRSLVRLRELIDSEQFRSAKSPVTVAVGRDIEGNIILADLAKMPHLLIAGSTGMGKSVCINSMLVSLIYKSSPEDVRLIMVDPKKVELDVYNGIPHLLVPVVCDPKKAAGALQWAVGEMDKRYALLNEHSVRNIDGYNALAAKNPEMEKMSRIVIVIDEMADLMSTSPKEVENAIARLAAMARAAGMHMVLATQRPSVDVITGTIKNNIPSRIAFAVSSQIDSRTILDESGAEGLIGKGDMLFNPVGIPKPKRVQGCFVDDKEVEDAVNFIKQNGAAEYDDSIAREIERNVAEAAEGKGGMSAGGDAPSSDEDPLFLKAVEVVIEAGQASTSMLQRRLGVGYARAGRLIDQLAEKGVVGPFEGSKPRQVLMSRQDYLEMTMSRDTVEPTAQNSQLSILNLAVEEAEAEEDDGFDAPPF